MLVADLNCSAMERTYAAANSPAFLAIRAKRDPLAQALAQKISSEQLFDELKTLASKNLDSLRDRAIPYVFLGALALQNQADFLGQALRLKSEDEWFKPVAFVLFGEATPNNLNTFFGVNKVNPIFQSSLTTITTTTHVTAPKALQDRDLG